MQLVFIHGNRATPTSFNHIRSQLAGDDEIVLDYDSHQGFYRNHRAMLQQLEGRRDLFFIAHSLGGIHALHLADALGKRVLGGITMSTPYGGSEAAEMLACMLPFSQVLKDIQPHSKPIRAAKSLPVRAPWTNLVSTAGATPLIPLPNDGVVTLQSMRARADIRTIDIDCNHFEILLHPRALEAVQEAVDDARDALSRRIVLYG